MLVFVCFSLPVSVISVGNPLSPHRVSQNGGPLGSTYTKGNQKETEAVLGAAFGVLGPLKLRQRSSAALGKREVNCLVAYVFDCFAFQAGDAFSHSLVLKKILFGGMDDTLWEKAPIPFGAGFGPSVL